MHGEPTSGPALQDRCDCCTWACSGEERWGRGGLLFCSLLSCSLLSSEPVLLPCCLPNACELFSTWLLSLSMRRPVLGSLLNLPLPEGCACADLLRPLEPAESGLLSGADCGGSSELFVLATPCCFSVCSLIGPASDSAGRAGPSGMKMSGTLVSLVLLLEAGRTRPAAQTWRGRRPSHFPALCMVAQESVSGRNQAAIERFCGSKIFRSCPCQYVQGAPLL